MIPSLREWHNTFKDQGLVVIGNHFPEFDYEREYDNLADAIERLDVPYPVTQDNEGQNWKVYENHYWPTLYLIDILGRIRYVHIGEGAYETNENAIRELLAEMDF